MISSQYSRGSIAGLRLLFFFFLSLLSFFPADAQFFKEMSQQLGITMKLPGGVPIVELDTSGRQLWFPGIKGLGDTNPIYEWNPTDLQLTEVSSRFHFLFENKYKSDFTFYDVNHDGHLDLVNVTDPISLHGYVFLSDSENRFSVDRFYETQDILTSVEGFYRVVKMDDVNFDGKLDLWKDSSIRVGDSTCFFLFSDSGYVRKSMNEFFKFPDMEETPKILHASTRSDLNQDGKLDYLVTIIQFGFWVEYLFLSDLKAKQYKGALFSKTDHFNDLFASSVWTDFNSDGELDFFNWGWGSNIYGFFQRTGPMKWENISNKVDYLGDIDSTSNRVTTYFPDLNNDGWVDIITAPFETGGRFNVLLSVPLTRNHLIYWNIATDSMDYHPEAVNMVNFSDLDNDGALDFITSTSMFQSSYDFNRVFINQLNTRLDDANWLKIWLEGSGGTPVGANVVLVNNDTANTTWWKQVKVLDFSRTSGYTLHFGTGHISTVDSVYVRWPSGNRDTLLNVPTNQTLVIKEGMTHTSVTDQNVRPRSLKLHPAYPNPFNPETTLKWSVATSAQITLTVYNLLGQQVKVLEHGFRTAGDYQTEFTAQNLPSGLYICRLTDGTRFSSQKVILLK